MPRHPTLHTVAAALLAAWLASTAPPLLAQAATPPARDAQAARYYEDALTRFGKKDFAGAAIQLKNALKIDNKSIASHMLLGKVLLAKGDVGAADVALNEALRLGVDRTEVVLPLAQAVIEQGRQQALLKDARFATEGLPGPVKAALLLMRAGAAADVGDVRAALLAIDEARGLRPGEADSWLAEVPVRIRGRQLTEARAAADKALALAPQRAEALYVRGTVSHAQNELAPAMDWYNKALALQPGHHEALLARAGLHLDGGRLADAKRDVTALMAASKVEPRGAFLKALIAEKEGDVKTARAAYNEVTALLDPVPLEFLRYRPQLLMLGGLSHYALRQTEKAKPYLESIQRSQPTSPVGKLLAQIHLSERNPDRAIESLEGYLRAYPRDAQAVLLLASTHMAQGRHARAAQLTQDALKLDESPDLRAALGLSLVGSGKIGSAVVELEAAIRKDPGHIQAGSALISIYLMGDQPARATGLAEALVKRHPRHAGLQNLLGNARRAAGDAKGARQAYDAALAIDPTFAAAKVNIARLEAAAGRLDTALRELNAVVAADDKNVDAWSEVARIGEQRGQLPEARRVLEKMADLEGQGSIAAGLALVDFHLRHRQPGPAREAARRLAVKAPDSVHVLVAMARVHLAHGDQTQARQALTRAATLANYDPVVLLRIALLQMEATDLAGAAYSLGKALDERPDFLPAQAVMAEIEIRRGDLDKGEQRARQIVARQPKLAVGHGLLGDAAMARGQTSAALDQYRRSHQAEPSTESLLRVFRATGLVSGAPAAQAVAENWLKAHAGDHAVRRLLADSYAQAGNLTAARKAYEGLVAARPDDAETLNNLANLLIMLGDPGALKVAERAVAQAPGTAHVIGTLGWAAYKAGQPDRALQLLRDARLRDPSNPDTRYFLGSVLAGTGRKAEARDELQAALKLNRPFVMIKEARALLATLN